MLETLDYTIRIGSIPTFLYFDLYMYIYIYVHVYVYVYVYVYVNVLPSPFCPDLVNMGCRLD